MLFSKTKKLPARPTVLPPLSFASTLCDRVVNKEVEAPPPLRPRRRSSSASPAAASPSPTAPPRYVCKVRIGSGAFSDVWQATDFATNRDVAVKIVKAEHHAAAHYEFYISQPLEHPHIVRTLACNKTPANELIIVQEFCSGGDLFAKVEPDVGMAVADARQFMHEILCAVRHIHSLGIVHRDLKPENVLVDAHGVAKLCDFGMAEHAGVFSPQGLGTLPYVAPEVLRNKGGYTVDCAQDLWSCGIILYILLAGDFPWLEASTNDLEYTAYRAGSRALGAWPSFSPSLLKLFDQLFAVNPADRGAADSALPFLNTVLRPRYETSKGLSRYRRRNFRQTCVADGPESSSASSSSSSSSEGTDNGSC